MSDFKVKADSLHVRRTPTVADNVVGFLHKGDVVQRLATSKNEQFLKVQHGDLTGWASKKWLTRITPKAQRYAVTADHLNVRRQPKVVRGNIKGTLDRGDVVTSDGSTGDGKWIHVKKGPLTGYASARYLRSVKSGGPAPTPAPAGGAPAWYKKARKELDDGVARKSGSADNPRVVRYLKSTNLGKPENRNDETPWCSAFVNWCVEQSGEDGTNSASARSWQGWGHKLKKPTKGCIVVLWRESKSSGKGHVGFYVRSVGHGNFVLLAGNQGDKVSTDTFSTKRVLSYRTL